MTTTLDHFRNLNKGDQISLVLAGIIVDGTFDGLEGDCIVLVDAKSSIINKKKNYTLKIPVESIYAWGEKQKKEKKKEKKHKQENEQENEQEQSE